MQDTSKALVSATSAKLQKYADAFKATGNSEMGGKLDSLALNLVEALVIEATTPPALATPSDTDAQS